MSTYAAGTYRLGLPHAVGADPGTYDAATPRLGRGVVQLVALVDLDPEEPTDPEWARLVRTPPVKMAGNATLTFVVPGTRGQAPITLPRPSQMAAHGMLGLLVAAVDRPRLAGDRWAGGPLVGDYQQPFAVDALSTFPWYMAGGAPVPTEMRPPILQDYWRPGPSLWPELAARGRVAVDLRALSQGARYLAVGLYGAWGHTAFQATGNGIPVSWTLSDRRVDNPDQDGRIGWPVSKVVASVLAGVLPDPLVILPRPDLFCVGTFAPKGHGVLNLRVAHRGQAGSPPIAIWYQTTIAGATLPGAGASIVANTTGDYPISASDVVTLYATTGGVMGVQTDCALLVGVTRSGL